MDSLSQVWLFEAGTLVVDDSQLGSIVEWRGSTARLVGREGSWETCMRKRRLGWSLVATSRNAKMAEYVPRAIGRGGPITLQTGARYLLRPRRPFSSSWVCRAGGDQIASMTRRAATHSQ